MKKLDNIVVKNIDLDHSKEIIKTFVELGVKNKAGLLGSVSGNVYYGVIHGRFDVYDKSETNRPNIKIITLEQLKAMKEDKSEYPKLMWVSDKEITQTNKGLIRTVICFFNNSFWSINEMYDVSATRWKYAQDIEEVPDPKQEEKTKVEFTGSLCMGDFKEKTMKFIIDGDIELNPGRYLITKID